VVFPGALYHLISRGNNRARVFRADADYEAFLGVLEQVIDRFGWVCHSYCLMGNHYHLLVDTPQPNLPLGMRQLNGVFAQQYNRRRGRVGHVFQARYKSVLVEREPYLLNVVRYIAWNPVRARLCRAPAEWRWSSYPALLGLVPAPAFLATDWVLAQFGGDRRDARERLREFVEGERPRPARAARWRLRYDRGHLRERVGDGDRIEEVPRRQWQPIPPTLDEVFELNVRPVAVAYRQYGYALREIAEHLGCHYSTVSRRLRREEAA
jgi:REP element-mobilizing transposase RayT